MSRTLASPGPGGWTLLQPALGWWALVPYGGGTHLGIEELGAADRGAVTAWLAVVAPGARVTRAHPRLETVATLRDCAEGERREAMLAAAAACEQNWSAETVHAARVAAEAAGAPDAVLDALYLAGVALDIAAERAAGRAR